MLSDRLVRAFRDQGADFVVLDGWSPPDQWQEARFAEGAGLLFRELQTGQQYTAVLFRLTEAGRAAIAQRENGDG